MALRYLCVDAPGLQRICISGSFDEFNLDIEADGEYWHSGENFPDRPAHDARRDAALRQQGYEILRLSEAEIKNGSFTAKLEEALGRDG